MPPRPVDPRDLLVRREIVTDRVGVHGLLHGSRVLVTGAGGFIGGELVRQCHAHGAEVWGLDNHEHSVHLMATGVRRVLADVRDAVRMREVMQSVRPRVLFHAAALKHVPLLEDYEREAAKTNVVGTMNVCQFAERAGVEVVVLVSTDKAVEPCSVMGRSKAAAEGVVRAADLAEGARCRYTAVRFGNVLGSTGSVVPLFQQQIAAGGPVTVTDERMSRWFITVDEACELVLQAATLARGVGSAATSVSRGEIYVLDMGAELRIMDIAQDMVRLSGTETEIVVTGLRPGERLAERLLWDHETAFETTCSGVRAVRR